MVDYAAKEPVREDAEDEFRLQWRDKIPSFTQGLSESEYLVFENMLEMFADLRELASYPTPMPSLEYTFERSVKMCQLKRKERLDKQLLIERFRLVLVDVGIPEGRPNKYIYRRKLRVMAGEMFTTLTIG
jgi:hypothetical protein